MSRLRELSFEVGGVAMKNVRSWGVLCLLACALAASAQEPAVRTREGVRAESFASAQDKPESPVRRVPGAAPTGELSLRGVPRLVKFSGVVRNSLGEPRTGVVGILFALYEEQEGGAPLWLETQNVTLDEQGRYTVVLGATQSEGLPLELFASGEARWLGIQVEGEAEQPRILLVSVPYALKAEEAERLAGRSASDFVSAERLREEVQAQVEQQVQSLNLETKTLSSGGGPAPAIVEGASTFTDSNASEVVLVTQNGTGFGLRAVAQSNVALYGDTSGAANIGVLGLARSLTGTTQGVRGQADSATGIGVFGLAPATTGANYGVRGQTNSTAGTAVFGVSLATTGGTFGVRGETFSTNASSIAVFGLARATTGAVNGVRGQTSSTSGIGVYGLSLASTGATTGVLGDVRSAAGTAVVARNTLGGPLLQGFSGGLPGTQVFSVDGAGNLMASGTVTATAFVGSGAGLIGVGDITAVNAGTGLTGGATSGDANLSLSAEARVRGITYLAGCDSCSVLVDADDQRALFFNVVGAMTITSVTCFSDAGTPTVNLQRDDGTPANILSSDLACTTGGATTTSFVGGEDVLNLNDRVDFVIVSAGGAARRVTLSIKATLN